MLVVKNIAKQYKGGPLAVDEVSLQVKKGEIYGFIGLNGAGKTTLIKMMLGMIRPTKGTCFINGKKVIRTAYENWRHVGYMVETPYSYPELTVEENLIITSKLRLLRDGIAVDRIIDQLKLTQYKHIKAGKLSLGNAQRLGLAKALVHQPKLLILDEPMNGLDPEGIVEIRHLLKDLAVNHDVTIFISSHILSEMAKLADKIGMIHDGKLIKEIEKNTLKSHLKRQLIIETNDNQSAYQNLTRLGFTPTLHNHLIKVSDQQALNSPEKIAKLLVTSGTPPTKLIIEEESLEQFFLRVINQEGANK